MTISTNSVLPPQFQSYEEYALALVQFLQQYEHLFNFFYYFDLHDPNSQRHTLSLLESENAPKICPRKDKATVALEDKVVLFLVNEHWTRRVPQEWRSYFSRIHEMAKQEDDDNGEDMTMESLFQFLLDLQSGKMDSSSIFTQLCPQSFLDYIRGSQELKMFNPLLMKEEMDDKEQHTQGKTEQDNELIKTMRLLGMNDKKKHEIERLGNAIIEFAHESHCKTVVDLGAGQGYLSQYIAFCQQQKRKEHVENNDQTADENRINVIAIDGNELQTSGCERRTLQIKNKLEKKNESLDSGTDTSTSKEVDVTMNQSNNNNKKQASATVHSVTAHLNLTITQNEFIELLRPYLDSESERILLIGLHTCGDLATTMIKLFLKTSAVSLASVACCYHKLSEDPQYCHNDCSSPDFGYPMSRFLNQQQWKLPLSTGKYLASNSDPMFTDLKAAKYMFKMHSYRAALELFLYQQLSPSFPESHFSGCIRPQHTTNFGKYAIAAMKKMQPKHDTYPFHDSTYKTRLDARLKELFAKDEHVLMEELCEFYRQLNPVSGDIIPEVQCFAAIRQALSPVIEALVLVDRLLYLRDQDSVKTADLIRVFHPKISPRGVILTATKKDT